MMIWAKRRFSFHAYEPYLVRLRELHSDPAPESDELMMVGRKVGKRGLQNVYVALPNAGFLGSFDGFEVINETDLPNEIDFHLYGNRSAVEKQFKFRDLLERPRR